MSDYQLNLSRKALNDIRKALQWYSDISLDLEDQLLADLDYYYRKIQFNPFRYGFYHITPTLRHVRLKRFPYYILYEVEGAIIRIAGIVHTARSPKFVRRRYQ